MDDHFYKYLIQRYLEKKSSDEELEVLMQLTREGKLDQYLIEAMDSEAGIQSEANLPNAKPKIIYLIVRWAAAAAVLVVLFTVAYFGFIKDRPNRSLAKDTLPNDIAPGGQYATLTLGNDSTIILSHIKNGLVASQGNTSVKKLDGGKLIYDANDARDSGTVSYNQISTPAGGEYQLVLADGTKVWLNSMSSLRYPTAFKGKERDVELVGEAYFEVAKNKYMPFRVISKAQSVEVLGTHFNINAYDDEQDTRTTLLEGSVKVRKDSQMALLVPGQQSLVSRALIQVRNTDTEEAVAWKNGYFQFNNTDIQNIMRQIERWYNVKVEYSTPFQQRKFTGGIARKVNLGSVLRMLEYAGIKTKMQDGKIIVSF